MIVAHLTRPDIAALQECDRIRDEMLPQHGVRLEDRDKGSAPACSADCCVVFFVGE
jgi:hypothetical protein